MKYRTRIQYTQTDKALMWERWRQGESLQAIAQLFDRNHSTIGGILSRTGGIRPVGVALKLALLFFVRPGELRKARVQHLDSFRRFRTLKIALPHC